MSSHSFIGRMSKLNNRYWLVTEHILVLITLLFHLKHLIMTLNLKHCLSRFEIFRESNRFLLPTPLYTTQNHDLFNTYEEGFSMYKGQRTILFNCLKMNHMTVSPLNLLLVKVFNLKIYSFFWF